MSPNEIQKLIEKYGQPAYDAAMRQVWVNLISDIIWIVVWIIVGIVIYRAGIWLWNKAKTTDSTDGEILSMLAVVAKALAFGPLLGAAYLFNDAIQIALNPQWRAIQILASLLPGK